MRSLPQRIAAVLLAGACVLGPAVAGAAQKPVTGEVTGLAFEWIDPNRTINLAIELPRGNPHDGSNYPVSGVTFRATRVDNVDLLTQQGWDSVASLTSEDIDTDRLQRGRSWSAVTDSNGVARFSDLPIGLYIIEASHPDSTPYRALPFLLTLPAGNTAGDSWSYDVRTRPKLETPGSPRPSAPPPTTPSGPGPGLPPGPTSRPQPTPEPSPGPGPGPSARPTPSVPGSVPPPGDPDRPDTPDRPGHPDDPGTPGGGATTEVPPGSPPPSDPPRTPLAETGADVWMTILVGALLVGAGLFLRFKNESGGAAK